jgi:hypothetical protein
MPTALTARVLAGWSADPYAAQVGQIITNAKKPFATMFALKCSPKFRQVAKV